VLLDDRNPEIVAAALDKIDDSSDVDLLDPAAARAWWEENRYLDQVAWLRRRNEQLRTRVDRAAAGSAALISRLLAALRNVYYAAADPDKDKLLIDFLNDPLAEVRGLGIELIDARITDRKPVSPELTTRVEMLIADVNAPIRRGAVAVLGDLRDKGRVAGLLAALRREPSSPVRAAIISALGRIGGSAATAAVQAALAHPAPHRPPPPSPGPAPPGRPGPGPPPPPRRPRPSPPPLTLSIVITAA